MEISVNLTVTNISELAIIEDLIHDQWFNKDDVHFNRYEKTLLIKFKRKISYTPDTESHYHYLYTLPVSGDYYVYTADYYHNATGTFEITLQRNNNPANIINLNYGLVREDNLSNPSGMNVYKFSVNSNDKITISASVQKTTSGTFSPYLELYDSAGSRLINSLTGCIEKYVFRSGGTFYLFVSDQILNGTGSYKLIALEGDVACIDADLTDPYLHILRPFMAEIIEGGLTYPVKWESSDNKAVTSHEIKLSIDGGLTYPQTIAAGLSGITQSFDWLVPADLSTTKARIKIIAQDSNGNNAEAETADFMLAANTNLPCDAVEINYEYDVDNQLTQSSSLGAVPAFNYTYDDLGNRLALEIAVNQPPVNIAPVAIDDTAHTASNTSVTINLLANDTDADGAINPASVVILTPPASGVLVNNLDGTVKYTPNAEFSGADSFTYNIKDNLGTVSNTAAVSVTVISETLTVTTALFRAIGARWIISGMGSVPGSVLTISIEDKVQLGTAVVSSLGTWSFIARNSTIIPAAGDTLSIESSNGIALYNVPITIRN